MTDPLIRIAVCLEYFMKSHKEFDEAETKKEIDEKGIGYYKLKYEDLWGKHQELLRELVELKKN